MADQQLPGDQENLIRSLALALKQAAHSIRIFETHISWILIAGNDAYKFKKAVHFDFLDFSTLDARHFYCLEELRLNRRLAPEIYLDVVTITGSPTHPVIGGSSAPIEYAVKMRAFAQQALWSERIEKGCLSAREIDRLAQKLAQFHQSATIAPLESVWGSPDALRAVAEENLFLITGLVAGAGEKKATNDLMAWQNAQQQRLESTFEKRKSMGFIREGHGDLHSGNILTIDDRVTAFDCIEFNESLRWIDVMNDLAFICMDLQFHGLHGLAARLLNGYLEMTGDYEGMAVFRYYRAQRALVRCKVALLRARQLAAEGRAATLHAAQAAEYLAFAVQGIKPAASAIILMHGYAGSGKSTLSMHLVELVGAVRIRSDVERKRMHGIAVTSAAATPFGVGLYDRATTRATYEHLRMLTRSVAVSGIPVIVDAAFLKRWQRRLFEHLATELGVPFFIVETYASEATLRMRVAARAQLGHDPSDAGLEVLAHQLAHHEALSDNEKKQVIAIDSEAEWDPDMVRKACEPIMAVLQNPAVDAGAVE